MLQSAIDDKKFLFSLTNPNGNRKDIEGFKFVPFQTTWGHKGEEFVTFLPRTKEEKEAYYKKSLERLKRKQEEKRSGKIRKFGEASMYMERLYRYETRNALGGYGLHGFAPCHKAKPHL